MGKTIYILNGPNLNLLGERQVEVYGSLKLEDIERRCEQVARRLGYEVLFYQSNGEGELIELVHEAREKAAGIVINAAGFTHSSVAILDALLACDLPVVEVHLSNIYRRESFRQHSYISQAASGVICGLGALGYGFAIEAIVDILEKEDAG